MGSEGYNYTLLELLCISEFEKLHEPSGRGDTLNAITEWAEQEVMSGSESEALLILASLNLDKAPDLDEVRYYLDRFMLEAGFSYPGHELSALTWLKIKLWEIVHCNDAHAAETCLHYFAIRFWDYGSPFFAGACNSLYSLYYYLFDSYGEQYKTPAEGMDKYELLTYIKKHISQFERKLRNNDWLDFLAKNGSASN